MKSLISRTRIDRNKWKRLKVAAQYLSQITGRYIQREDCLEHAITEYLNYLEKNTKLKRYEPYGRLLQGNEVERQEDSSN